MKINRTKNAVRNIAAGFGLRIYQTVVPFLMRTVMIHCMGVEYLGLNSLFSSILHMLNLAELGVGVAMVFSMYKPVAEDDGPKICALMRLYRRYYRLIGLFIGAVGLVLTPFIPHLISGEVPAGINVYVLYLLNLGATVVSYWLFAYRNCLLSAYQRRDVSSVITIFTSAVQNALQLFILIWLKDYYLYVIVLLLGTALNNVVTGMVTMRMFPQYRPEGELAPAEKKQINGKIGDLFTAKLGSVVLNYADTIVMSAFLGLTMLAVYQNYYFILSAVLAVIEMMIGSVTAGLGNSFVTESREKNYRDLLKFTFLFLWMTGMCVCCFLAMYQPFMEIWMGEELMLPFGLVICFAVYFYVYTLNRLLSIYKDAAGLWHQDRFNPLISALVNLALNLLLVKPLGLYGVQLATILSLGCISIPWQLHNLFTLFFERGQLGRFAKLLGKFLLLTAIAGVCTVLLCSQVRLGLWMTLLLCIVICLAMSNVVFLLFLRRDEQFRPAVQFVDRLTRRKLKLEKLLFRAK